MSIIILVIIGVILGLRIRDSTLLRRGLRTLQDIAALSPDELRKIKGIEKKGYNEIVRLLKKYGINTDKGTSKNHIKSA